MQLLPELPIQPYQAYSANQVRQLVLAVLLALLLHALVLFAYYVRPTDAPLIQRPTIEVSLEAPAQSSAPITEKPPTPLLPPEKTPSVTPVPQATQAAETPQPASPAQSPPVAPPQTGPSPSEEIQPLFRLTRQPKPLGKIEAAYPASERRAGIQANVLAEVTIDSKGNIQDVRILKSAGNAFDAAVIEALRKSTFTPGFIGDQAVSVRFQIPFRFNLN